MTANHSSDAGFYVDLAKTPDGNLTRDSAESKWQAALCGHPGAEGLARHQATDKRRATAESRGPRTGIYGASRFSRRRWRESRRSLVFAGSRRTPGPTRCPRRSPAHTVTHVPPRHWPPHSRRAGFTFAATTATVGTLGRLSGVPGPGRPSGATRKRTSKTPRNTFLPDQYRSNCPRWQGPRLDASAKLFEPGPSRARLGRTGTSSRSTAACETS